MSNPFFHGDPVSPDQFLGRRSDLRRITDRIVPNGQSSAIVGEPRTGKTSLLRYLAAPETRADLYGDAGERLLFSFIDSQMLDTQCNQARFWELALCRLDDQIIAPNPDSLLAQVYRACQEKNFDRYQLERLFVQMELAGWRLVLLLDEFDILLYHTTLCCGEFFGSLRSLASRCRALALVIASRRPLTDLNKDTQQFSRTSSPYFNIFDPIALGPLSDDAIEELLGRAGDRFRVEDCHFVKDVAGGHPYLLQVAASELWRAYEDGERDPYRRRRRAGDGLYDKIALTMSDTWQFWSPEMRKALTVVALAHIPYLLSQREFDVEHLLRDLRDFGRELKPLEKQGFIVEDEKVPGGWRVHPGALLWWLADELLRIVRDETPFEEWLRAQEWDGLLKRGEKQQLDRGIRAIAGLLKDGAATLIEAAAKGVGEAVMKGG